jgi:hypothetical protein
VGIESKWGQVAGHLIPGLEYRGAERVQFVGLCKVGDGWPDHVVRVDLQQWLRPEAIIGIDFVELIANICRLDLGEGTGKSAVVTYQLIA